VGWKRGAALFLLVPRNDDGDFGEDLEVSGVEGVDPMHLIGQHGGHELQIEYSPTSDWTPFD
jgi:hypothetical protein